MSASGGTAETRHDVALRVNGTRHQLRLPARRLLSDALRHDLGLRGTHVGCEHGVCGACTVLVDGRPARACLMLAVAAVDVEITTVEGLAAEDGTLGPVQQAFVECHGLQCGFCTPGFLTTITAGLAENPDPTHAEAREMVAGNLCRCTGYQNIVAAVERAAVLAGSRGSGPGGPRTSISDPGPGGPRTSISDPGPGGPRTSTSETSGGRGASVAQRPSHETPAAEDRP